MGAGTTHGERGASWWLVVCTGLAWGLMGCQGDAPPKGEEETSQSAELHLTVWWYQETYQDLARFEQLVSQAAQQGAASMVVALAWKNIEPSPGQYTFEESDARIDRIIGHGLRPYIILDAAAAGGFGSVPEHFWRAHPECSVRDFDQREHGLISLTERCTEPAFRFFAVTADHFVRRYPAERVFFQPNFNNEYEWRYAQGFGAWQDFSEVSQEEFRHWLQRQHPDVSFWSHRWARPIGDWSALTPPVINYPQADEPERDQSFYDWQRFREERLVQTGLNAALTIRAVGGHVFLHFGEFGTANDGIYVTPLVPMALSGLVEEVMLDSNLMDARLNKNDPLVGAVLVSAARRLPTVVTFEVAVERLDLTSQEDRALVTQSLVGALEAGADRVALANLSDPEDASRLLADSQVRRPAAESCTQAIYRSRWQYYAMHGTSRAAPDGKVIDPLQADLFGLYRKLREGGCVEIWDDELVTPQNLSTLRLLSLEGALLITESTASAIQIAEQHGLVVQRDTVRRPFVLGRDFVITAPSAIQD